MKTTASTFDSISLKSVSFCITGYHPTRELETEDHATAKEDFETCRIVSFPRGFEPLQIAVFGSGLDEWDCIEAAHEWLMENNSSACGDGDETAAIVSCVLAIDY